MIIKPIRIAAVAAAFSAAVAPAATPARAEVAVAVNGLAVAPQPYVNCTAMHAVFEHGVAKPGARDKVRGNTKPVTSFVVDQRVYTANKRLDRDKDGVACEKR